jgi:homoserine O-acetyltransferase
LACKSTGCNDAERVAYESVNMDQPDLQHLAHQHAVFDDGLALDCGVKLRRLVVAYRTYGRLNADRSNAVLVCHALTGDQYVAETHPVTGKNGWWDLVVGRGLALDTDRFFVICANVLGGCMGSTGPSSPRDDSEENPAPPWGIDFPPITIRDMVRAQKRLIDHLGIARLFAVLGGSMGGMQVLEWASTYPDCVFAAVPIATAAYHSAQNIAFNEVGRQAIFTDPDWHGGKYWQSGAIPARGLAVARMVAHITYLSDQALTRKFGRRVRGGQQISMFGDMFEVESYLRHQGSTFVRRFDANSYLSITRANDYFDLAAEHDGDLAAAFTGTRTRFCIISFSSDWLYPTAESRAIARALNRAAANVSFVEIASDKGHDAFLLDEPDFHRTLAGFLAGCAEHLGLPP